MKKIVLLLIVTLLNSCSRPEAEQPAEEPSGTTEQKSTVAMTLEAQAHIGLLVIPAEVRNLTEYLPVTGTIQPMDTRVSHVRGLATGRLISVSAKVGDRVSTNQTLALFDNVEATDTLAQHQAARFELERLNVQLSVARQNTERNHQLSELGAIPRKEYDLSLAEEKSLSASIQAQESVIGGLQSKLTRYGVDDNRPATSVPTAIRAPFAGIVIAADAAPGEVIGPEDDLFQIADLSQVWVQGEVYEKDLGRIQVGQTASIVVDTYPDREFLGRVTYISDVLDPQTRTAKVRCEVVNTGLLLKLDMFATVRLPTTFSKEAIAIPAEAIQQLDGRNVVFIRTGETTFEPITIQVGRTIRGLAEVISGLEGGERVVTKGAFHLKSIVLSGEIGEEE